MWIGVKNKSGNLSCLLIVFVKRKAYKRQGIVENANIPDHSQINLIY